MKRKSWTFCNDLSGREWIPEGTVPGHEGWFEDVPRRVYIGVPGLFFTFSPQEWPPVDIRRKKEPRPRTTHLQLVLAALHPEMRPALKHYVDHHEWGLALIEALAQERERDEYLDHKVREEVDALIAQRGLSPALKRAMQLQLDKFNGVRCERLSTQLWESS